MSQRHAFVVARTVASVGNFKYIYYTVCMVEWNMPVFTYTHSRINLPEGHSYSFLANPYSAEWYVVPYYCGVRLSRGKRYQLTCLDGRMILECKSSNPQGF